MRTDKALKDILTTQKLEVDCLASFIDKENLFQMIRFAEDFRSNIIDDYEVITSPVVKEIVLKDYQMVNKNIKALRYAIAHFEFMPVVERVGN